MYQQSKINTKLIMALSMAVLLVACKSTPMTKAPVEDKSAGSSTSSSSSSSTGADDGAVKGVEIDSNANDAGDSALRDPNNILSKRNIYFDYDSDAVKAEYRPLVDAHAKYLLGHAGAKMILQGNTDERGTREYNLSLGQRRSVAVKNALNLLGVKDEQIETVSYGEEKSEGTCSDESCYQQNRRVDIVYTSEN
jgi:peptidoglycan-associated lipoprotein